LKFWNSLRGFIVLRNLVDLFFSQDPLHGEQIQPKKGVKENSKPWLRKKDPGWDGRTETAVQRQVYCIPLASRVVFSQPPT
jgi:hypothetical protein